MMGPTLVEAIQCDGLLIDTFHKNIGMGLLDHYSVAQIAHFVEALHAIGKEAWIAGSITLREMPSLWATGVDVICVRGAACAGTNGSDRFGEVSEERVKNLLPPQ
jgi:hypothetical protein